jgi:hypothetical protein
MGDKNRAPERKNVLQISLFLFNPPSFKMFKSLTQLGNLFLFNPPSFKNFKSLTQLDKWSTQKYHQKQHIAYVLLLRRSQKIRIFSEINFFGKNHAVLAVQHPQPSINGKVVHQ